MKILYIFAHPDDESFGPAAAIKSQVDQGHQVFLLSLTRGGATRVRHKLGITVEQMGEIRYQEMLKMEKVLGFTGMTVLDLPDSGLSEMDPRVIEKLVAEHIRKIQPGLVVSYPVHGVSGFHDHIVTHAVVKRVYLELQNEAPYLKRLAFVTIPNRVDVPVQSGKFLMKQSEPDLIDCEVMIDDKARQVLKDALSCYETYRETIEKSGILQMIGDRLYFEIYNENHKPVLQDLTDGIK